MLIRCSVLRDERKRFTSQTQPACCPFAVYQRFTERIILTYWYPQRFWISTSSVRLNQLTRGLKFIQTETVLEGRKTKFPWLNQWCLHQLISHFKWSIYDLLTWSINSVHSSNLLICPINYTKNVLLPIPAAKFRGSLGSFSTNSKPFQQSFQWPARRKTFKLCCRKFSSQQTRIRHHVRDRSDLIASWHHIHKFQLVFAFQLQKPTDQGQFQEISLHTFINSWDYSVLAKLYPQSLHHELMNLCGIQGHPWACLDPSGY